jgi:hypothetical protein
MAPIVAAQDVRRLSAADMPVTVCGSFNRNGRGQVVRRNSAGRRWLSVEHCTSAFPHRPSICRIDRDLIPAVAQLLSISPGLGQLLHCAGPSVVRRLKHPWVLHWMVAIAEIGEKHPRQKIKFARIFNAITCGGPACKNILVSFFQKSCLYPRIPPHRQGAYASSRYVEAGCDGRVCDGGRPAWHGQ